jgi:predicted RNase H-like nuclease
VFPVPARAVLDAEDYAHANAISRRVGGRGLPRQSFGLLRKIAEVDELARRHRDRLVEIHPECAFARWAGEVLAPKKSAVGITQRRSLVATTFAGVPERLVGAGADDIVDAYAVLWSTRRYAAGTHVSFGDGSFDAQGLPMRIVS